MKNHIQYHRMKDDPRLILSDARYKGFSFKRHYHLDYHIGLVSQGVQTQNFKGQKQFIGPGVLAAVAPDEIHDGVDHENNGFALHAFRISPKLMEEYYIDAFDSDKGATFGSAIVQDPALWRSLSELYSSLRHSQELSKMAEETAWIEILQRLFTHVKASKQLADSGPLTPQMRKEIRDYCVAHMADKISLSTLAELCGLSRFQLLRRFKESTGLTPHNWLTQFRLEHACTMLRQSDSSIAQIATDVGFYDQSHFIRAFKGAYGVVPSQY